MPGDSSTTLGNKLSYAGRVLPSYAWQWLTRRTPPGPVHLIIALANHFEPSIVPEDGSSHALYDEQEQRVESWCRENLKLASDWRDHDGRPFVHTYFYPAEQYDRRLIQQLADHCHAGWGEIEIHLHHGISVPDTASNTRRLLTEFRDALVRDHGCLSGLNGLNDAKYAFVHGNFALANSADGKFCGVDDEIQVLAETGCYADLTLPTAPFHPAQIAKINSLYACAPPLGRRAAHRQGRDLQRGYSPQTFPLMIQGPLMLRFPSAMSKSGIENGAITRRNPLTISRLRLWKQAAIHVLGKPDWLFIKLHCHGMDPMQHEAVLGAPMRDFLRELVQGAEQRGETLHFVTAREMTNIILAAYDGKDGTPGDYRDYRLRLLHSTSSSSAHDSTSATVRK
jgi:hypothetical protein